MPMKLTNENVTRCWHCRKNATHLFQYIVWILCRQAAKLPYKAYNLPIRGKICRQSYFQGGVMLLTSPTRNHFCPFENKCCSYFKSNKDTTTKQPWSRKEIELFFSLPKPLWRELICCLQRLHVTMIRICSKEFQNVASLNTRKACHLTFTSKGSDTLHVLTVAKVIDLKSESNKVAINARVNQAFGWGLLWF